MQSNSAASTPPVYGYGLAIVFVLLALLTSLALQHSFGNPFWFFFSVAVILSTWFGRSGAGWFAVVCSGLCVMYFFTPPLRSFAVKPSDFPYFLTFIGCEVGVTQVISWRKRADDSLRKAHDELEARVAERTAELKNAHSAILQQMAEQRRIEESLQVTRSELARVARITTIGELTAGIGVDPEVMKRLFEPFFTTRPQRHGHGIVHQPFDHRGPWRALVG